MTIPRKAPAAPPAESEFQAMLLARLMDLIDAVEDACHSLTVIAQCQLSELAINSHQDGYVVDPVGMVYDANGAEKAPRLFPDQDSGAAVSSPETPAAG